MDSDTIFPEDIFLTILTRLPAKSLHRFKCVSKNWLSLITSPHFLKSYLTLSPPSWILAHTYPRTVGPYLGPGSYFSFSSSLAEPPNISYLTISGFPREYIDPKPPTILTSSNGLILLAPVDDIFWVVNPVTNDSAVLPAPNGAKINAISGIGMAAEFTPPYEDVSLVLMDLQAPKNPAKEAATLLVYKSDTGWWETRTALYKAGSRRGPNLWKADTCFEVGGSLFWVKLSCGLLVLENPFGKNLELRFIPLPDGHELPLDAPGLVRSRVMYPAEGFMHYYPLVGGGDKVWRLTDVKKGEWSVVFKTKVGIPSGMPEGLRTLPLTAFHPFEDEVAMVMVNDKSSFLNLRENKLVSFGTCPAPAEDYNRRSYEPVVLPPWPSPLPKRLEATSFKEKGNFHFRHKYFKDAVDCYSRSIRCFPRAAAYANRAAAHLKLGKYQEAEIDCSEALKLDNQYLKVYARRASARKELGKLLEAKEDVEMALKLDGTPHQGLLKLSSEINCLLKQETVKGDEDGGL